MVSRQTFSFIAATLRSCDSWKSSIAMYLTSFSLGCFIISTFCRCSGRLDEQVQGNLELRSAIVATSFWLCWHFLPVFHFRQRRIVMSGIVRLMMICTLSSALTTCLPRTYQQWNPTRLPPPLSRRFPRWAYYDTPRASSLFIGHKLWFSAYQSATFLAFSELTRSRIVNHSRKSDWNCWSTTTRRNYLVRLKRRQPVIADTEAQVLLKHAYQPLSESENLSFTRNADLSFTSNRLH